ncbi:hypothetical protein DFH06DRAFT_1351787 [Mycena polygramma]|nr:hypothetical protein DFH06DRAFT_1351787 [Mycena polygramma]
MPANNPCLALVLYMPVWTPQTLPIQTPRQLFNARAEPAEEDDDIPGLDPVSDDEDDDVPELISEETFVRDNIYRMRLPLVVDGNFRMKRPLASESGDLQHGEQWAWDAVLHPSALTSISSSFAAFTQYDISCRAACKCSCHKARALRAKL